MHNDGDTDFSNEEAQTDDTEGGGANQAVPDSGTTVRESVESIPDSGTTPAD